MLLFHLWSLTTQTQTMLTFFAPSVLGRAQPRSCRAVCQRGESSGALPVAGSRRQRSRRRTHTTSRILTSAATVQFVTRHERDWLLSPPSCRFSAQCAFLQVGLRTSSSTQRSASEPRDAVKCVIECDLCAALSGSAAARSARRGELTLNLVSTYPSTGTAVARVPVADTSTY